jgi:hypothetical protein
MNNKSNESTRHCQAKMYTGCSANKNYDNKDV